jgi:hypothetical protein
MTTPPGSTPGSPPNALPAFDPTCLHDGEVDRLVVAGAGSCVDVVLSFLDLPLAGVDDDWGPHWRCVATLRLRSVRGLGFRTARPPPRDDDAARISILRVAELGVAEMTPGWLLPFVPRVLGAGCLSLNGGGEVSWSAATAMLEVHEGEPASVRGGGSGGVDRRRPRGRATTSTIPADSSHSMRDRAASRF